MPVKELVGLFEKVGLPKPTVTLTYLVDETENLLRRSFPHHPAVLHEPPLCPLGGVFSLLEQS